MLLQSELNLLHSLHLLPLQGPYSIILPKDVLQIVLLYFTVCIHSRYFELQHNIHLLQLCQQDLYLLIFAFHLNVGVQFAYHLQLLPLVPIELGVISRLLLFPMRFQYFWEFKQEFTHQDVLQMVFDPLIVYICPNFLLPFLI